MATRCSALRAFMRRNCTVSRTMRAVPVKADSRGWGQYFRWPTAEEQENWIKALVQTGARAQRVYVLSVQQTFDEACGRETHILAPETADGMPRLNEKAMRVYDNMIAEADKQGCA